MPQNKLKAKVEALTRVVQSLMKQMSSIDSMARGTLTALQLSVGEKEWDKIVEELKNLEKRDLEPKDKKLEI
jgi:hypothetical protein